MDLLEAPVHLYPESDRLNDSLHIIRNQSWQANEEATYLNPPHFVHLDPESDALNDSLRVRNQSRQANEEVGAHFKHALSNFKRNIRTLKYSL